MKYYVFMIIITCCCCNLFSDILPDSLNIYEIFINENGGFYAESGRDEILAELELPEDLKGITCLDICFIPTQNVFYVYGDRKILVYDGNDLNFIQSIELSNKTKLYFPYPSSPKMDKMCYIPEYDLVACHSNEGKIVIIDPSINSIINEINYPEFIFLMRYDEYILKFNNRDNNLYMSCNYGNSGYTQSCLISYSLNAQGNISLNYSQTFGIGNLITDVVFNPYRDRIYANFYFSGTKILNSLDGSEINTFTYGSGRTKRMCFVDNYPEPSKVLSMVLNNDDFQLTAIDAEDDYTIEYYLFPTDTTLPIYHSVVNNKVYIGGKSVIYVIDDEFSPLNPPQPQSIYFSNFYNSIVYDIVVDPINNRLFLAHYNGICVIDTESHEIVLDAAFQLSLYSRLSLNTLNGSFISISPKIRKITKIDNNLQIQHENVGCSTNLGIYCSGANKIFLYEPPTCQLSDIVVLDLTNNSRTLIEGIPAVSGMVYDEVANRIYISSALEPVIRVMDATSNILLPNEYIHFDSPDDDCQGIFLSPNRILYCALDLQKIALVDLSQQPPPVIYDYISLPLDLLCNPQFVYNESSNEVWISVDPYPFPTYGKIFIYDDTFPQTNSHAIFNPDPFIKKMKYANIDNEPYIIFQEGSNLWKVNQSYQITNITPCSVYDFDVGSSNSAYIVSSDSEYLHILDLSTNEESQIQMPGCPYFPFYNYINNKLYTFVINPSNDYNIEIATLDCITNEITSSTTGSYYYPNIGVNGFINHSVKSEFILNPDDNILYFHPGDNVVKILQCDNEEKTLSRDYNWESFPRLERDAAINEAVDVVPILETIEPFDDIELINFVAVSDELTYNINNNPLWQPYQNYDIQSTRLYKIKADPYAQRTLELSGTRIASNYQLEYSLYPNAYQWLGFWLPGTQNMIESFDEYWQYVEKVKSEEWFYSPAIVQRGGDPTYPIVLSAENLTLSYGKGYMVLFKENTPPITDFHWTLSAAAEEPEKKAEPENFTYTEKADYEAIDVFNIPPSVTEIGVFEDEVCVGAVVVEDTCAQILVYSENANRDPIPFTLEVVTGRGFSTPIKDYQVLNLQTGKYETISIFSGRQEYSIIRFSDEDEPENEILSTPQLYGNYPNPFNPKTTISFSLPEEEDIELTIYNIKGQKVKTLYSGLADEGEHTMIWEGKDSNDKLVSSGLYFYKLKTNNKELTRKMLMMK